MKILGICVYIIQNKRIKASIRNNKFKDRIFSSKELKLSSYSKNKIGFFSKRFAAKEAFAKALGTGFRNNLNFKDIEIMNDKLGKPYYAKTKKITKIIRKEFRVKNFNCFLSISDEKEYSTAFAIIEMV
jgi:holo-[acyl-carrier protein] synthase